METGKANKPIFLVGCPSSGTTLLQSILNAHPNISCGPETDFLLEMQELIHGRYWNKLQHYNFPKDYWLKQIKSFFSEFKAEFSSMQGKSRWADKSPVYTSLLPFIIDLFPECQIIHIIRDGRDVVNSHRQRWGYKSAIKASYLWNSYVSTAREFGSTLPQGQYFELHYEDLVLKPEETIRSFLNYLNEPWHSEVLHYNKDKSYAKKGKYAEYTESRRAEHGDSSLIYKSSIGTGRKLDPILKLLVYSKNTNLLKELGYIGD